MIYHIYGAGDEGSRELVNLCLARNIGYMFQDIRTEVRGKKQNLISLFHHRLYTVPQVFDETGNYVGNYEAAVRVLRDSV